MEKKKVLVIASVASMIQQFNIPNIKLLQSLGYDVDVATNFENPGTISVDKSKKLIELLDGMGVDCYQIDFNRNVFNLKSVVCAYKQLKKVFSNKAVPLNVKHNNLEKYAFTHCHSPIGGVIGRLVAKKYKVRSIYTAHGFHFYKGAPFKNWLIYYPIEKFFSRFTDTLITINKEDYERAKDNFSAKKVIQIPGAGVDTIKFESCEVNVLEKRKELGIPGDAFVLLSIGELNDNKNQKVVIEAVNKINKPDIFYLLVGRGNKYQELNKLIKSYSQEKNIRLLGYRTDTDELCKIGDCFVHPSLREGLGLAPLEAMASGLPLISSYVGGIKDYTQNGKTGYCLIDPLNDDDMVNAIQSMYKDKRFRKKCSIYNQKKAKEYDISKTNEIMKWVYKEML